MDKFLVSAATATILGFLFAGSAFAQTNDNYNKATINWQNSAGTRCYRIYYKESSSKTWQHAVRCKDLSANSYSYTIQYLKPNTLYTYDVAAVDYNNKEHLLGIKQMQTAPMH
ncbi:MAG: fibronectin type III domain-containing protein [Patescibacteria group bacterium]|nr:fibronectin type III domain-containing protein [Patescibacteria group bacterium]